MIAQLTPFSRARFESVDRTRPSSCWPWTGPLTHGYGYVTLASWKREYAHRVAWQLARGPIPAGRLIHHKCHDRSCVNPRHMELVSRSAHQRLHWADGHTYRNRCGERAMQAKLTEVQVREIRRRRAAGDNRVRSLAAKFGVSPALICLIAKGRRWRHVA